MKKLQDYLYKSPQDLFQANKAALCRAIAQAGCTSSGTSGVTSVTISAPLTGGIITTTGTIGIDQATSSVDGYISAADWTTFNSKAENTISDGLISGGTVTWISNYDYVVSPSSYYIGGVLYSSPSTNITLSASAPVLDRIDIFTLTTSSTAVVVEGIASGTPEEPDFNPNTQIRISSAIVLANTTSPTITNTWIYQENTEWTTTVSGGTINAASTNNPYAGTKDVEGTLVVTGNNIVFTPGVAPTFPSYDALVFKIRSKASWGTKRLSLRWLNGTTAIGNAVAFGNLSFGFVSTNTSSYQNITIPLSDFGAITAATKFRMQAVNAATGFGFYIDDIQLIHLGLTPPQNSGTVTSVSSGSLSPLFTTAISNPTTTPALSFSLSTHTANTIFAGPSTGAAAAPTFRALVTADMPAGLGTVTSLGLTSSDITVGGTASPITTSGTFTLTLPTVNSNVGTFGSATQVAQVTANGKGQVTAVSNVTITPAASSITGGAALTKSDDTNVTLTLGGAPTTALLTATSLTLGWAGTLASGRLNSNVVQSVVNDTNVTGSIAAQALTLGWTGQLSVARGGSGQSSYTNGQLLIGNTSGNTLTKATLTAGGNISITNGAGAITIAASSPSLAATAMFNYINFF